MRCKDCNSVYAWQAWNYVDTEWVLAEKEVGQDPDGPSDPDFPDMMTEGDK